MLKLITILRLHSMKGCSNNIWMAFLLLIVLVGINYRTLIMPIWLIATTTLALLVFSIVSIISFAYWVFKYWEEFSAGRRLYEVFYFLVLLVIILLVFYISLKIFKYIRKQKIGSISIIGGLRINQPVKLSRNSKRVMEQCFFYFRANR